MAVGTFSLVLLACSIILSLTSFSACQNDRLARQQVAGRHPPEQSIAARYLSDTQSPFTPNLSYPLNVDPLNVVPNAPAAPSFVPTCQPFGCRLFYPVSHIALSRLTPSFH